MTKLEELLKEYCPEGVEYKTLGELGTFYGGLTGKSKSDFSDGNAKFITYMNVYSNLSVQTNIDTMVKIKDGEKQHSVQYGDVLFTGSSETADECGISSVMTTRTNEKFYLNSFCFGFRFNEDGIVEPEFAKYVFRSDYVRKQLIKTASGVTRFNVSKKKMECVSIPLPPLAAQREIVRILDNFTLLSENLAENLAEELAARLQQYEYYRDELLTFGDEVPRMKLGEVGPVCMCKRILKSQTNPIGGVPFYKIGTFGKVADAYISIETYEEYVDKYHFPNVGDILISAAGTIGRTVVYDGKPAYFQDSNIVWIANNETKVLNKFLFYIYKLNPWHISSGGTISRLYNDNILNAVIPVPSLSEQERIVDTLEKFDALCHDLTAGLPAEIEARRQQYEYYRDKLLTFEEKKKDV